MGASARALTDPNLSGLKHTSIGVVVALVHPRDCDPMGYPRGHGGGVPQIPWQCLRPRRCGDDSQKSRPSPLVVFVEGVYQGRVLVQRRELPSSLSELSTAVKHLV